MVKLTYSHHRYTDLVAVFFLWEFSLVGDPKKNDFNQHKGFLFYLKKWPKFSRFWGKKNLKLPDFYNGFHQGSQIIVGFLNFSNIMYFL
jgi:hypothetical protein